MSLRSVLIAMVLWCIWSAPAAAAQLLVIDDPRCGPCIAFKKEIGRIYGVTAEGQRAPMHVLPFESEMPPPYQDLPAARVAPTFVLVEGFQEIGRFEGYASDELFWMSLNYLLQKLSLESATD